MILLYKNITHFISFLGLKLVWERERDRLRTAILTLIFFLAVPHLALLLLNWGYAEDGASPPPSQAAPNMADHQLCDSVSNVTAWLTIIVVGADIYVIPKCPHVIPVVLRLSTHMSRLNPCISVFLFTQLEHDSSIKGQYATYLAVQNMYIPFIYLHNFIFDYRNSRLKSLVINNTKKYLFWLYNVPLVIIKSSCLV